MKINQLFKKPVDREINGVIKVDQNDSISLKLELDEYVITKEGQKNLKTFFENLNYSADNQTDKIGVWISGFFGSGKSHFLKMLALLLNNQDVEGKKPYEYFKEKLEDEFLIAELSKSINKKNKVILFNIDSKAESNSKTKKDAIVNVLMKVFNNSLGYCGEIPWLAKLERELDEQNLYKEFKDEFLNLSNREWEKAREDYYFETDKIYTVLAKIKKISTDEAKNIFESAERSYVLSIEKFVEIVKKYVDKTNERIIFFIDEIGQYIGDNTDLMLNLQTVTEDLGVALSGKAWIVVTSQEALDQITIIKGNDFSKIKGRFATQLVLTSSNTDTVIKKRLLEKKEEVKDELVNVYRDNESILKNLISFSADTSEMKFYKDEDEFVDIYPYIPFQFNLVQKVFEKIRLMGASGAHLAKGERSLLSAFQEGLKQNAEQDIGILVPFSSFYSSIEVFLTHGVSRTINQAGENSRLEDFDIDMLKVLFMIKYLDVIKSNVENLKTLLVKNIDEDKIALGDKIKESLERLEGENLIHKSGEEWIFLTDEEQDINKEIKSIQPDPTEIIDFLHDVIFSDIYQNSKYRYPPRNKDFSFLKIIDNKNYGSQQGDITIQIFTPYSDEYEQSKERITLAYNSATACIVLPNIHDYLDGIREVLQIKKYISRTNSQSFSESLTKIRNDKSAERSRLELEIKAMVENALTQSSVYVNGSELSVNKNNTKNLFEETFLELVKRTYTKLNYIDSPFTSEMLSQILIANDVDRIDLFGKTTNVEAVEEIRKTIERNFSYNKKTLLSELKKIFTGIPFGWSDFDVAGVLLVLFVKGLIAIKYNGEIILKTDKNLINLLTSNREGDKVTLTIKEQLDRTAVQKINKFASSYFDNFDSIEDDDILVERLKVKFGEKINEWGRFLDFYKSVSYPSKEIVLLMVDKLQILTGEKDTNSFFNLIDDFINFLSENKSEIESVENFFKGDQKKIFDDGYERYEQYEKERIIDVLPDLSDTLNKLGSILKNESPYSEIKNINPILNELNSKYGDLLKNKKDEGVKKITDYIENINSNIPKNLEITSTNQILYPLNSILNSLKSTKDWTETNSFISQIEDAYIKAIDTRNSIVNALETSEITRNIKTVKIIDLVKVNKDLETDKDVDNYVDELGIKLKEEIKKGNTIKLL